jgi:hypothetical protein
MTNPVLADALRYYEERRSMANPKGWHHVLRKVEQGVAAGLFPTATEADIADALLDLRERAGCTCVGGSWCPHHGTCTCGPHEERKRGPLTHIMGNIWGEPVLPAPHCPLHGTDGDGAS